MTTPLDANSNKAVALIEQSQVLSYHDFLFQYLDYYFMLKWAAFDVPVC